VENVVEIFNHQIGYTAVPAATAAAPAAGSSSRRGTVAADATRCGLRRTPPGDEK